MLALAEQRWLHHPAEIKQTLPSRKVWNAKSPSSCYSFQSQNAPWWASSLHITHRYKSRSCSLFPSPYQQTSTIHPWWSFSSFIHIVLWKWSPRSLQSARLSPLIKFFPWTKSCIFSPPLASEHSNAHTNKPNIVNWELSDWILKLGIHWLKMMGISLEIIRPLQPRIGTLKRTLDAVELSPIHKFWLLLEIIVRYYKFLYVLRSPRTYE